MSTLNLRPEIETYNGYDALSGVALVKLSDDFQKIYDSELDRLDCVKNYYFEDPHHCRVFTIKDTDKFREDLQKVEEHFKFEMITPYMIEAMTQKIEELCIQFVYGDRYIINSSNFYKKWDKEKFSTK